MKRRSVLTGTASAAAAAVAGCISGSMPGGDSVSADNTTTDGGNATGDGSSGGELTLADTEFSVEDAACGTETNEASVTSDEAAAQVVVEGTISAPNPCYTARLGDVTFDAASATVRVPVTTEKRPDTEVCSQCIAEIEYRAVVSFDGGLPGTVEVVHGDEVVTTASAGDGSA